MNSIFNMVFPHEPSVKCISYNAYIWPSFDVKVKHLASLERQKLVLSNVAMNIFPKLVSAFLFLNTVIFAKWS